MVFYFVTEKIVFWAKLEPKSFISIFCCTQQVSMGQENEMVSFRSSLIPANWFLVFIRSHKQGLKTADI